MNTFTSGEYVAQLEQLLREFYKAEALSRHSDELLIALAQDDSDVAGRLLRLRSMPFDLEMLQ